MENMEPNLIENILNLDKEDLEFTKKYEQIISDVKDENLTVLEVIERLQPLLTNVSPNKREMGVIILTSVLENIPSSLLNTQQISLICAFFADRLKDQHQVIPHVLKGVIALIKCDNFPDGSAGKILVSIFHNIACQQQQQVDRHNIYFIFKELLEKHTEELCSMGLDFVYGVISAIDSERDPKNLVFLFKWIPTFLKTVSLGHLVDEMFDVLSCYFPVDFRAPPQDPNSLTRENLSETLCPCLCAIPEFSEQAITLAIEKLDSSLMIAKIDSLQLIKEGCKTLDVSSYVAHSSEIWSIIQKELFNCKDPNLETLCLQTFGAFLNKLTESKCNTLTSTLRDITDTLKGNLLPDAKLFSPSVKLFLQIALSSEKSAEFMLKEVVPVIENTYRILPNPVQKSLLLNPLVNFAKAFKIYKSNINDVEELKNIPVICLQASIDNSYELRAAGFDSLSKIADILPQNVRATIYENLKKLLLESQPDFVRKSIISCFKSLSENYGQELHESVLTSVVINDEVSLELYLNALCEIANVEYFTTVVIDQLMHCSFKNDKLRYIGLYNIKKILEIYHDNSTLYKILLEKCLEKLIVITIKESNVVENDVKLISVVKSILKLIIGYQSGEIQKQILDKYLKDILECKNKSDCVYTILLNGILERIQKSVEFDYRILDDLINLSMNNNHLIRNSATELLANLLNKCSKDEILNEYLTKLKALCQPSDDITSVTLLTWINKALVVRNYKNVTEWIDLLIEKLNKNDEVSKLFRLVLDEQYECLSAKSYCNIMFLYKQKFFTICSNKIAAGYSSDKKSYLSAIGYLIEFAPDQAIILQFNKIATLVLLCLEQHQDTEVLLVILRTIHKMISNGESVIEERLEDFMDRILNLTRFEGAMSVRIAAIKCLQSLCGAYPVFKLLPQKRKVINQLANCVDDKKRCVRKEAMKARSEWYLLDAPQ